jgi:DNA-binding phage protein
MTVQDIAKDMGITRQYAHRALKSAMGKMWKQAKKVFPDDPPFKLVLSIMKTLGIDDASQEDINSFVGAFPEDIQKEIKKDAVQFLRKKKSK